MSRPAAALVPVARVVLAALLWAAGCTGRAAAPAPEPAAPSPGAKPVAAPAAEPPGPVGPVRRDPPETPPEFVAGPLAPDVAVLLRHRTEANRRLTYTGLAVEETVVDPAATPSTFPSL